MKTVTIVTKFSDERVTQYLFLARTYIVMSKLLKSRHYLAKAKECLANAKAIKVGFMRPLGVFVNEAA